MSQKKVLYKSDQMLIANKCVPVHETHNEYFEKFMNT